MTFLAPWALAVGALAALGAVLLHLVARQRPAAVLLPTARFVADRRSLVSTVVPRPRDGALLALRVLTLLAAAAAFAKPVLSPARAPLARVVLLDRSVALASSTEGVTRLRPLLGDRIPTRLIVFDSAAASLPFSAATLDSLARTANASATGSLSAALAAARRIAGSFAAAADSVELVVMSPLAGAELDDATLAVRAQWPGRLTLVPLPARVEAETRPSLERGIGLDDPRGPAVRGLPVAVGGRAVRLRTTPLAPDDSAFARGGGTVVRWDSAGAIAPTALAMGDDVVVAALGRGALASAGHVIARWADGAPAAQETPLGEGCLRTVRIGLPTAGDLPLSPAFQRIVRGLLAGCGTSAASVPATRDEVARLAGAGGLAHGADLAAGNDRPTPLVPWLLALALLGAIAEPFVRRGIAPAAP